MVTTQIEVQQDRITPDQAAIGAAVALAVVSIVWNAFVGLSWTPPLLLMTSPAIAMLGAAAFYAARRPAEATIIQILLYVGLWLAFPIFVTRITFIGAALAFPMRDHAFAAADLAIGFHWDDWAHFTLRHPLLLRAEEWAYASYFFQPMLAILLLAFFGKPSDNARLFLAMALTFTITTTIHTLWPAVGPGPAFGIHPFWEPVIAAVRAGHLSDLPYLGIVTFPSFHAAMAVLLTLAYQNVRRAAYVAAALNALMLLSIPFCGRHYLVDLIAGVAIAVGAWLCVNRAY